MQRALALPEHLRLALLMFLVTSILFSLILQLTVCVPQFRYPVLLR